MSNIKVPVRFVSSWEEGDVESAALLNLSSGEVTDIETSNDGESEHYESLIREYITVADGEINAKVELQPNDEYRVDSIDDLELLRAHFNYGLRSEPVQAGHGFFVKHLCSRIFARNGYGSPEGLIAAIKQASAIPETEWRSRKAAFNQIGEKAPMTDSDGYLLKYEDVPAFIEKEADAFLRSMGHADASAAIPRFKMRHSGDNPGGYTAEASRTGDAGIYEEVRIGIFKGGDKECLGDVLVGLTEEGEPRVLVTTDGNGEEEASFVIYPLRPADEACLRWEDAPSASPRM